MPASVSSTNDVAARITNALALSDPELDTSIGSPLRKIIDSVSQEISQHTTNSYLINYQYDVDSKTGGDLDDFVANFGIARLLGKTATGVVTFSRPTATANLRSSIIPAGTLIASMTSPPQYAQTLVSATLGLGQASADIPVQATTEGPDGNLLAGTLNTMVNVVDGVTAVNNSSPLSGGTLTETDAQLQERFKTTAFRNLAGTDSMYRGIALQTLADPNDASSTAVSKVNILGASSHSVEQIQVVSGTATSSLTTSAATYTNSVTVTSISTGAVLNQNADYTIIQAVPLQIQQVGTGMPDGLYQLEYDYVPISSRNDPFGSRFAGGVVNNRVDVYVNGLVSTQRTQTVTFVNTIKFNNTANDPLLRTRFITPQGTNPANNDIFVPLAYGPITAIPSSMLVGSTTYNRGTNYDIVHQDDAFGYAPQSKFGLVWYAASSPAMPANNTTLPVLNYTVNNVPTLVAKNVSNWRLLGTDVQVHAGKSVYLVLNFAIVYDLTFNIATVNTAIQAALSNFLQNLGFNAGVQVSDIVQVVHNVPGVDNVRLTTSTDNPTTYAMQSVTSTGSLITTYNVSGRPTDVYFDERSYPVLYSVNFTPKARNTFRT